MFVIDKEIRRIGSGDRYLFYILMQDKCKK